MPHSGQTPGDSEDVNAARRDSAGESRPAPSGASTHAQSSPRRETSRGGEDRPGKAFKARLDGARKAGDKPGKPAKKIYPPRGIARSTGARASPPAPQATDGEHEAASAGAARHVPPTPATAARLDEAPRDRSGASRGLSKESPRLAKLVSQLTQCSRREADEWIENGWVSVDGVVTRLLGTRTNPKARIEIQKAAHTQPSESVSIVLNKPPHQSGPAAGDGRQAIATLIRADNRWAEDKTSFHFQASHLRGLTQAGRLEDDEGGMLAFTQEGSVARRLTGGARLEKEYHVRVEGELAPGGLDRLRHGLSLDNVKLQRAQVSWLSDQQLRFVMIDVKKGLIRRMCALVGLQATDLKRVRIGSVSLGRLPPGQWRYLREDERF